MSVDRRSYSTEFKIEAVRRFETWESVTQLAHKRCIRRKFLYHWREQFRQGLALPERRPPRAPRVRAQPRKPRKVSADQQKKRIVELERQLGMKQMEVDFLKRAFEQGVQSTALFSRQSREKNRYVPERFCGLCLESSHLFNSFCL